MECIQPSVPLNTVDICDRRKCRTIEIHRDDLSTPHLPSHRTFKTRKWLLYRDIGAVWSDAKVAIERGDRAIMDALASYGDINAEALRTETIGGGDNPKVAINEVESEVEDEELLPELWSHAKFASGGKDGGFEPVSNEGGISPAAIVKHVKRRAETEESIFGNLAENLCFHCGGKLESPCWYCINCLGLFDP